MLDTLVIPAHAGAHIGANSRPSWVPAFAGMTTFDLSEFYDG